LKKGHVFSKAGRNEKRDDSKGENRNQIHGSNLFVFCEKTTGVAQFRAGVVQSSEYSLERIAGLFAMQCLVRGYDPNDFVVLVPAEQAVISKLVSRAKELLDEGRAVAGQEKLSPRQKEILHSVLCNRANKEIASRLNITVRTVKFHISSLLSKFGVDNRTELARRAAGVLRSTVLEGGVPVPDVDGHENLNRTEVPVTQLAPRAVNTKFHVDHGPRSVRFQGRVATA
jgi:DNA-binding CsgD family transcriptional regulator